MTRLRFWLPLAFTLSLLSPCFAQNGRADRDFSVKALDRIARPVIQALAEERLKKDLPLGPGENSRASVTHLEAFGRTLAGISPWLALGPDQTPEGRLRARYIQWSRQALVHATDPRSPDYLNFKQGSQPLVDAAFLAQALLQAPDVLWKPLEPAQKQLVVQALKDTRAIKPYESNWLLFSALVEAALWDLADEGKIEPIEEAIRKHESWYLGDGTYGDGPQWHWDYYNSFVIQPALLTVLDVCKRRQHPLASHEKAMLERARRYAAVQERLISPEGTYPVIGRSAAYRFGALQHLSFMAGRHQLPSDLKPGSVRHALTSVVRRTLKVPGNFDDKGWLQVGAVGHQPSIREGYISTGSLYLCLTVFHHLGLPPNDPLWTEPATPWTQQRIWSGADIPADHALGK